MGEIRFKYSIDQMNVTIDQLIYELEYGNTFILGKNYEKMITLKLGELAWVDYDYHKNNLEIIVDDNFFSEDDIFEKIITSFLFNLMDFGDFHLDDLDFSESIWESMFIDHPPLLQPINTNFVFGGTIIKPYYHTSLDEKIDFIMKLAALGFSFVKEDETYLLDHITLKKNTIRINAELDKNIQYVPNVTSAVCEYKLIESLLNHKINTVMVNILVAGFRNIRKLKLKFPELNLWGHRVGFNLVEKHISVRTFSKLSLMAGISYLHIGTPISVAEALEKNILCNELFLIKPDFIPIFTKTSPEIIKLIEKYIVGKKILMACGYFRNGEGKIDYAKIKNWIGFVKKEVL